jgi:CheY-like chemotaxis protein
MDDALGPIVTDRLRLRQILVNVLSNAVKFTDAGSVEVSMRVSYGIDGEHWTIDVADTGIGIAPEHHAGLFEPFGQANASISRTYGGSGLGLALSRRLAELLGGSLVLLRSAPGAGTAFRLTLKSLQAAAPEPDLASAGAESGDVRDLCIEGLRILLAEDHRDLHIALRKFLEQAGATVQSAYDGREAVAIATLAPFDVVLMDLKMPHLDGFEATRALRKQGCAVPIIALTADLATVFREAAMDAGCDACLSKPFTLEALSGSIRRSRRP